MKFRRLSFAKAFTLTELLVVVAIIIILAVAAFLGTSKFIQRGKKIQALAQFRDLNTGLTMFVTDYQKPPIPESKRLDGYDTIYGDAGGNYPDNAYLVAILAGEDKNLAQGTGENFNTKVANPNLTAYMQFPLVPAKKGGLGPDGNLYDPWGSVIMAAVNGGQAADPNKGPIVDFNGGSNDRRLHTWGMAEYEGGAIRPNEQDFVFWSYGLDKQKGNGKNDSYAGSDDVISWAP